jgi:predicted O-methyltransferase YrrM
MGSAYKMQPDSVPRWLDQTEFENDVHFRREVASYTAQPIEDSIVDLYMALNALPESRDRRFWSSIERRRKELISSQEVIENIDYGAGFPAREFSPEQQRAGVRGRRSVSEVTKISSSSPNRGRILYLIVRQIKPQRVLELGSCVGISGAYIAAALERNGIGQLWTLEGSPSLAKIAQTTFAELLLSRASVITGPFHETFPSVFECGPFDFAFIDGHHDGAATIRYFHQIASHASPRATFLIDDIDWSDGMRQAWHTIRSDALCSASCTLGKFGVLRTAC